MILSVCGIPRLVILFNILQASFASLFALQLVTSPDDQEAKLTVCGRFVAKLAGLDVGLGRMVALGVVLGVGWEATVVASAAAQDRTVFGKW